MKAVGAEKIREMLESVPNIQLPTSVTNPVIDGWIEHVTAQALHLAGKTELPEAGSNDRALIDSYVTDWVTILARRRLHPGREDLYRALNEEQKLIEKGLRILRETDPKKTESASGVAGGVV